MREIHISIFNPDKLRFNELYCKLNRYTAKIAADPFEPHMYFHVDEADIFTEKLELQCLLYDTVITYTFPNMSIENLYVCIYMCVLRSSYLFSAQKKRAGRKICYAFQSTSKLMVT